MSAPPPERLDVVVLGAGAAGLIAAAACGRRGRSVLVLDHADRAGSKIRISGGGRCNFTNRGVGPEHYRSRNPHFCRSALARFGPGEVIALLERHGVAYAERDEGQLFCTGSANAVVSALERECHAAGVAIRLGCRVKGIEGARPFTVRTDRGEARADSLVVATGGLSYPKLGASGFGHEIAARFGLGVVPPQPVLAPFVFAEPERSFFRALAGVSLPAAVACAGRSFRGKILFTHRGLSGPAVLQASLRWSPGETVSVDLLPGVDVVDELRARRAGKARIATILGAHLPRRFASAWCERRGVPMRPADLPERELRKLAGELHDWRIAPAGTEGYATAEATAGGVDTAGLSSRTLEARAVPGLFFAGEVVDVTGEVGGYNLHWAWASGHAAGQHA